MSHTSTLSMRWYKSWYKSLSTAILLSSFCSFHFAKAQMPPPNNPAFYTIEEMSEAPAPAAPAPMAGFQAPQNYFPAGNNLAIQARDLAVNLLRWALHKTLPPLPQEPYDRLRHFGRWINDPTDETCYNTRSKVLIRDSAAPVSFRQQNRCVVDRGAWNEPYTGQKLNDSHQIQIDHMVPLKNAYLSGAWQWNYQTRCLYANFMGNRFHLISASGTENMRKGDRGPDNYLPPASEYRCEYLENWLKIKLIWRLRMSQSEVAAIHGEIQSNRCDPRRFKLSEAQLKYQRSLIVNNTELCPNR